MVNKNRYNTKQRSTLLNFFENNKDSCFTAKDIIKNPEIDLGEATVYRVLAKFVEDGTLKKYASQGSEGAYFQYNSSSPECNSHFHLKCTQCGTLFHMDCHLMDSIKEHIKDEHSFTIDNSKTTLYGICDNCNNIEQEF